MGKEGWLWKWMANHLPSQVVYFATIRLLAHATAGKYGETEVSGLTVIEAMNRWSK